MSVSKVLITGATSGIGHEAAALFATSGYGEVIVTGRSTTRAGEAAAAIAGERLGDLAANIAAEVEGVLAGSVLEGVEELPIRVLADDARRAELSDLRSKTIGGNADDLGG